MRKKVDKSFCCHACGMENDLCPWEGMVKLQHLNYAIICGVKFGCQDCKISSVRKYLEE